MLSRVAERLYWMARSLERVESMARLFEAHAVLLMDMPDEMEINWFTLIRIFDIETEFHSQHKKISEQNIMQFLITDRDNPSSIYSTVINVRENARTSLDILPEETWEQINQLYLLVKQIANSDDCRKRHERQELLHTVIEHCQCIRGIVQSHMSRTYAYYFCMLGRCIEQADMNSRIIEMTSLLLSEKRSDSVRKYEGLLWANLLQALSAHQMFLQTARSDVNARNVLNFLILDRNFPGSLYFLLDTLESHMVALPQRQILITQVHRLCQELQLINPIEIPADDIHIAMDNLQNELASLHNDISKLWFDPEQYSRHSNVHSTKEWSNQSQTQQVDV